MASLDAVAVRTDVLELVALYAPKTELSRKLVADDFNASSRAKEALLSTGIISASEQGAVRKVLSAAALTYVAATLTAILTLVYFLLRSGVLGGRSD